MKSNRRPRSCGRGTAVLLILATLAAGTPIGAAPIPPAEFTFDVSEGGTVLSGCMPQRSSLGGTCGSEASAPGFAATSGGIGTASYLPVTPGGTPLGTGTAVDSLSIWTSGASSRSSATMSYSFQASGPASVNFIPIDVISTGLAAVVGNGTASLSLVIRDAGTEANIPPGVHDLDPKGALLDLTAKCSHGSCITSWDTPGHQLTNLVCVVNGDNYVLDITAQTRAGAGASGMTSSASAVLDPVIKLDPPYPTHCPLNVSPSLIRIATGPGASTGVATPEPSTLGLAAAAAVGLALAVRRRRTLAPSLS